jgi:valyl-tRNA synthetase
MENQFVKYLDEYEIGLALNHLEKFFWNFCDNYIEIVKHRLYRPEEFGDKARYSGQKTVYLILYKLLQDFSIFFPYITEEIYQELYKQKTSIHLTEIESFDFDYEKELELGEKIVEIVGLTRGAKTNNSVSLKTPVKLFDISLSREMMGAINEAIKDFKATLFIEDLKTSETKECYIINKIELDLEGEKE